MSQDSQDEPIQTNHSNQCPENLLDDTGTDTSSKACSSDSCSCNTNIKENFPNPEQKKRSGKIIAIFKINGKFYVFR